jgi:hypothetical protein
MDSSGSNPQYQRAVTPTLEKVNVSNPNPVVRGKPLSYQQSKRQQIQLPRQTITQNIVGSLSQKNTIYPNNVSDDDFEENDDEDIDNDDYNSYHKKKKIGNRKSMKKNTNKKNKD